MHISEAGGLPYVIQVHSALIALIYLPLSLALHLFLSAAETRNSSPEGPVSRGLVTSLLKHTVWNW